MSSWKYVEYRERMNSLPPTSELAARLRDGEPLKTVASDVGLDTRGLANRLRSAGYMITGESETENRRRLLKERLSAQLLTYQEPWMADGLCAQVDGELWYPERGINPKEARAICAQCPVRDACRDFALRNRERWGVWGGTTERERRKLLKGEPDAA